MGRYAVIDIGTNSVKLFCARVVHGRVTRLAEDAAVTRLGHGLAETGELSDSAMENTLEAVIRFRVRAEELEVEKILAVGTAAFRRADNADEFLDELKRRAKVRVKVLDGEEEARLSAVAVRASLDLPSGRVSIADIGGGSTELVRLVEGAGNAAVSLPVGVRTLTDAHATKAPLDEDDGEALAAAVAEALAGSSRTDDALVGVGGTVATLAAIRLGLKEWDHDRMHGLELTRDDVEDIYERLAESTLPERRRIDGLPDDRVDVMPAGAALVLGLMVACGVERMIVCACGLRHGVFHDAFVGAV